VVQGVLVLRVVLERFLVLLERVGHVVLRLGELAGRKVRVRGDRWILAALEHVVCDRLLLGRPVSGAPGSDRQQKEGDGGPTSSKRHRWCSSGETHADGAPHIPPNLPIGQKHPILSSPLRKNAARIP